MDHAFTIIEGLVYSGLVIALLSHRLSRRRPGPAPILAATIALALLHGLLTFALPAVWTTTWLLFWIPGHILTPLVLLWRQRRHTEK